MAAEWPIVRRNLAVWLARIHIVIFTRGADLEMPCWVETLQRLECSGIPFLRIWTWNFGVADIHGHVVCPQRHLAWDRRSLDRDVRTWGLVRSISPKVRYRFIKDGLQISTQLIIALRRRRGRGKEKKQGRKYRENCLEHGTVEMPYRTRRCRGRGGIVPTLEACLLALNLVNPFLTCGSLMGHRK